MATTAGVIRVSKNKPKETIEYVIRLQDKERQLLESYLAAYTLGRAGLVFEGLGVPELTKNMKDPSEMIGIFYSIAMILEFMGIETGLPTPADADGYFHDMKEGLESYWEKAGNKSKWYNPASWKIFDFIGDLQASAFGIDRDNPPFS